MLEGVQIAEISYQPASHITGQEATSEEVTSSRSLAHERWGVTLEQLERNSAAAFIKMPLSVHLTICILVTNLAFISISKPKACLFRSQN